MVTRYPPWAKLLTKAIQDMPHNEIRNTHWKQIRRSITAFGLLGGANGFAKFVNTKESAGDGGGGGKTVEETGGCTVGGAAAVDAAAASGQGGKVGDEAGGCEVAVGTPATSKYAVVGEGT